MQPDSFDHDLFESDGERRARARARWWRSLGILYAWRRFIAGVTFVAAVAAVVLSLLLPNEYYASARLLLPESSGGLSASLLRNLPSAASAFLDSGGGDETRYLAILTSRSVMEAAVDTFDLIRVYDVADSKAPLTSALKALADMAEFEVDMDYEFLSVGVYDEDPERAAAMANFFVRRLNETNARLSSESAGNYRRFVEDRYLEARAAVDSLLQTAEAFQRRYGVYDLPTQTQTFFEQVAALRTAALEAEIQHEALREQYGAENPQVKSFATVAQAANRKYLDAINGQEYLMPIGREEVPDVVHQYARMEMERTIQASILEVLGPMYEHARLQEEREVQAVQVVDPAVPPELKARPKRSIICILATLSAFLLAVSFALVYTWAKQNHASMLRRLQAAAEASPAEASKTTRV